METEGLKAILGQALASVEGWLYLDEAWALHEVVRRLPERDQAVRVVEIGSWKGRSTIALAMGVKARGAGTVYAIDPHTGEPGSTGVGPVITAVEFGRNVAAAGVDLVVELLVTTSHAARPLFEANSIDVLFIDGSHQFDDVMMDIADWSSALKDAAVVAFNDPSAPGVYRALREFVLRSQTPYRRPALVQNTLIFEFRRTEYWSARDAITLAKLRTVLQVRYQASRFRPYMPVWLIRIGHALSMRMVGRSGALQSKGRT